MTERVKFYWLTATLNSLSGIVCPFKNEAKLMAHSVYSTGGMHRLSTCVQEGGIMFFSKLCLVVWETVLLIGTKHVMLDWRMLTSSATGYAKSTSYSLGFPFEQKQFCHSFHLQLKSIYWWRSGSLNEKYNAPVHSTTQDCASSFCNQTGAQVLTAFIVMRSLISLVVFPCNGKESSNGEPDHCQMDKCK